jgi:hypothetical protein
MSNCDNDISSQIKALHARLDRVDDDLTAHFAAQYLQAIAFLANPITAAQGSLMTAQFASRAAFKALVKKIPGYEQFKQLQHLDSAALVSNLETALINTASGMVDTAVKSLETAIDAKLAAARNHILAIEENAIDSVVGPLLTVLNETNDTLNKANAALNAIQQFLKTLNNISSCQAGSSLIKSNAGV